MAVHVALCRIPAPGLMAALAVLLLTGAAEAQSSPSPVSAEPPLTIQRNGSRPSVPGPASNFTGKVRVDQPFQAEAPGRVAGGLVTFEPGARTAWHTHPLGQTLIVTAGVGRVQRWGGPVQEIQPGDVVWIPPGVKHWHGASLTVAMTHLAIAEQLNGQTTEWLEPVSDPQYQLSNHKQSKSNHPTSIAAPE